MSVLDSWYWAEGWRGTSTVQPQSRDQVTANNWLWSTTSTEPVQISVLAWNRCPVARQYQRTTSSEDTFRSRAGDRPCSCQYRASTENPSAILARYQAGSKFLPGPRWKSRIYASIYKRYGTAPVVNKDQCLYWAVGTGSRVGAILA